MNADLRFLAPFYMATLLNFVIEDKLKNVGNTERTGNPQAGAVLGYVADRAIDQPARFIAILADLKTR